MDGSIQITSSVWKEDMIVPDVWFDDLVAQTEKVVEVADYYLLQMNFLGNIL